MAKKKVPELKWLGDVEVHDYAAAESYLTLFMGAARVGECLARFREAAVVQFRAKDIFRASGLSLLGISNSHIEKDRRKIEKGQALAPLMLVRDEANGKVVIADGYHRLCAIYGLNEDVWIHCKIV